MAQLLAVMEITKLEGCVLEPLSAGQSLSYVLRTYMTPSPTDVTLAQSVASQAPVLRSSDGYGPRMFTCARPDSRPCLTRCG